MAEDLLFATLDPTMRQISLPGIEKAILSDTVGFVSELPTQLIAAFRATLEEVISADLILHVRDIAHRDTGAQAEDVHQVLREIGAEREGGAPILEIWNKLDLLDADTQQARAGEAARDENVVLVSALDGTGFDQLQERVSAAFTTMHRLRQITVNVGHGAQIAWLHNHGVVINDAIDGEVLTLGVRLSDQDFDRFSARFA
jgi:GTP-binding protein HflX